MPSCGGAGPGLTRLGRMRRTNAVRGGAGAPDSEPDKSLEQNPNLAPSDSDIMISVAVVLTVMAHSCK